MRRLTRSTAAATLGALLVTTFGVTVGPNSHSVAEAADERARPASSSPQVRLAAGDNDPVDYWTEARMAQAIPLDNMRNRKRARPTVSDEVGDRPASIAGIGLLDEASGGTIQAAAQPAMTYPFPFGRRYVEKKLRKKGPYKAVGRVFFRRGGQKFVCSGASVVSKPRQVVFTAGHCLHSDGKWSTDVVFIPARTPGKKNNPFGVFAAKRLWVPLGWRDQMNDAFDMGTFSVRKNKKGKKLQKTVGALGFAYNKDRVQHWEVFGFPAQKPFKANKLTVCSAQWARDDLENGNDSIGLGCDMSGGSSGGPWILNLKRGNLLNGIITYGYGSEPGAVYGPYFGANANWIRCAAAKSDENAQSC
jgi:V8-like Glu-specific endopeptidase